MEWIHLAQNRSNGRLFCVDYSSELRGSVEFGEFLDLVKHCDVLNMAALHVVARLTLYSPVVTICTASLTFNNSTFCPHSCVYVFCVDLRTNSDYFPIQH